MVNYVAAGLSFVRQYFGQGECFLLVCFIFLRFQLLFSLGEEHFHHHISHFFLIFLIILGSFQIPDEMMQDILKRKKNLWDFPLGYFLIFQMVQKSHEFALKYA